ncbi:RNA polymerase sigma factor [Sporosarcina highlanderae]|uniref:RNA polymerase sigma factor 70 region 4 type 2 domain-containing protein n=1 Tax=Sporosarcina highlanderae TaxID=3035916 RepID=A0ABT8JY66_9BACL|nr:sigma factor-like helix-turn-helix DNA-binding protein [Sporosarcina highlanderae]MDN4609089.1 hypothetical protein [Sporosarcina highlanderae]
MEDLKHRILQGNQEAIKEWVGLYIRSIERFAISYGVALTDAGAVTETVFRNLYHSLEDLNEDQLDEIVLFKNALIELEGLQIDDSLDGLFPFEEDNELHRRLIGLSPELRVPLILFNLHGKSISEIAAILDQSEQQVEHSIKEAYYIFDDPNLEKKLGLLNKSNHRLVLSAKEKNIYKAESVKNPSASVKDTETKVNKRKPFLFWGVGVAMLIGLLFISVIRGDAYQYSSSEKFIEELKASFEQKIDDRFTLMGIEKPMEDTVYHVLDLFGDDPQRAFAQQIQKLKEQLGKEGKIDRKAAEQNYQTLLKESRLPSEMIEELRNNPLTEDREQSHEFMNEFTRKVEQLTNSYMGLLANNYEEILMSADLNADGVVDKDLFLEKIDDYPLDLQNAIKGMETQFFFLGGIKDIVLIYPQFGTPEIIEILNQNLHPDMNVYTYLLSGESLAVMYGSGTMEEKMNALLYIEKELPKTTENDALKDVLYNRYSWLVYNILGIYQYPGLYDDNYSVRQDVRDDWKSFAASDESSPSVQVMQEVLKELENNNWKSTGYDIESYIATQLGKKVEEIWSVKN